MNAALAVRHGDDRDRAFVRDLGERTVMDSVPSTRDAIPAMARLSFERLLEYVYTQSHVIIIAEENGTKLGFLILLDTMPDEVTLAPQAFIAYMAVEPGARRRGIGSALLEAAQEAARERNLPTLAMMVTEENAPARRLYEQAGFGTERRLLCKRM
jgi:ribosomal-protein-alanine N-acetyltransferase